MTRILLDIVKYGMFYVNLIYLSNTLIYDSLKDPIVCKRLLIRSQIMS